MRLATLHPRTQLLLTIAIPLLCLALAVGLVWPHFSHLREVKQQLQQTQETITQKESRIKQVDALTQGRPLALAVVPASEEEPIAFLKQLAALTKDSGTTITSVRALGSPRKLAASEDNPYGVKEKPKTAPSSASSASPGQRPVVPTSAVQELQDTVTVEGSFADLLALIVRLENYDRLLSVSQCRVQAGGARAYPQLRATFTLSRFVAAPTPAAAGAPASASRTPITAPSATP